MGQPRFGIELARLRSRHQFRIGPGVPQEEAELRCFTVGVQAICAGMIRIGFGNFLAKQKLRRFQHSSETHFQAGVETLQRLRRAAREQDSLVEFIPGQGPPIQEGSRLG